MNKKIVNESTLTGIHIWSDGTIHLNLKKWDVETTERIIHIYKK